MGFFKSLFKAVGAIVGGVVGFMVGGPIGAVIGAGLGYAGGGAVADIVSFIFNPGFDVPDADINQNQGITVNKQGTNNNIPVVYGERYIGGSRVAVMTSGSTNEYLWIVLALAEGEISAVKSIYMDDTLAWSGTSTHGGQYEATQGKFPGYLTFQIFHGRDDQTVSSLAKQSGAGWTDSHRLRGVAYLVARCKWYKVEKTEDQDKTPWKGGIPNITCVVQGRKVAACSTFDSTVTRSTVYEDETEAYSTNPVDCLLDYMRNPVYGKGLTNDKIDFLSFKTEAARINALDDGSPAPADLRQECNGIIFTDRTIMQNIKTFLFNMRAAMPYSQGRFKVSLNDNRDDDSRYGPTSTAVMSFDHDDIIGTVSINSETNQSKYNRVIVTYMGGGREGLVTNEPIEFTWPEPGSTLEQTFLEEDNDRINEQRLTYEMVTQDAVARKIAQVALAKSRYRSKTIGFTVNARAQSLEINDIISVFYNGLGVDGKFRVSNITMNNDYTFSIVAEEHNDLMYAGNPLEYVRKIHRVGEQGTTPEPIYYLRDPITNQPIYDDPRTWEDMVNDPNYGTPEDVLDGIGNDGIVVDQPVDIYRPPVLPTTIDTPTLLSMEVRTDTINDPLGTNTLAELRFNIQPDSNPVISDFNVWYQSAPGSDALLIGRSSGRIIQPNNGLLVAYRWPKAQTGQFSVQLTGETITSGRSNGIYIGDYIMANGGTVTSSDGASPPPDIPLPVPDFTSISFAGSGSGATATVNWTPVQDARIRDLYIYQSEYGTGQFIPARIVTNVNTSAGTATVNWAGFAAADRLLYLVFDPDPLPNNIAYGLTPSNKIYVLTTDQVDGTTITSAQSEPFKVPVEPLETPVLVDIDIQGPNHEQFIMNFTPPTDPRVTDAVPYYIDGRGTVSLLQQYTTDLVNGTVKIQSTRGSGFPMIIGSYSPGFFMLRFKMAQAIVENPNGDRSADSNQIYVEEADWNAAPTTVSRDYKPAPRPIPIPVLNSIDVLSPEAGGTNTIRFNTSTSADSRLLSARMQYLANGQGNWIAASAQTTGQGQDAPENGTFKVDNITQDATSNGILARVQWLTGITGVATVSNAIWVTRTQLDNPPVSGITEATPNPLVPVQFEITEVLIQESTDKIPGTENFYTNLVVTCSIPLQEAVGLDPSAQYTWSGYAGNPQQIRTTDTSGWRSAGKLIIRNVNPATLTRATANTSIRIGTGWSYGLPYGYTPYVTITLAQLSSYGTVITP